MIQLLTTQIDEKSTPSEVARAFRNLRDAVADLQKNPLTSGQMIKNVELADTARVPIPHNFGRPASVFVSSVRNIASGGVIEDISAYTDHDRRKFVTLQASGYGSTITVDVILVPL